MGKSKNSSDACFLLDFSFPCRLTTFTTSEKENLFPNFKICLLGKKWQDYFSVNLLRTVFHTTYTADKFEQKVLPKGSVGFMAKS